MYNPPPGPGASWSVAWSGLPFTINPVNYYTVVAADTIQMARFGVGDIFGARSDATIHLNITLFRDYASVGYQRVSSDSVNKPTGVMDILIINALTNFYQTVSGSVNIISVGNADGTPLAGTFDVVLESDAAQAPKAQYRLIGSFSYPYTSQFGYGPLN